MRWWCTKIGHVVQEALRRGLLLQSQLAHGWIPHALIRQHVGGNKLQGDILAGLDADTAVLLAERPREKCRWTCRTDKSSHLELSCRPVDIPPVDMPPFPPPPPPPPPFPPASGAASGAEPIAKKPGFAASGAEPIA